MKTPFPVGTNGPSHRRGAERGQSLWIVFGGAADQPWLRLLRPGFRHCFAAICDRDGWIVFDPLSHRLIVARLDLPPSFDLPRVYARAGLLPLGPFMATDVRRAWLPSLMPYSCVTLCRQLLGASAPFALTPWGLFRRLRRAMTKIGKNA